ncbi:MAG: extracellular solute-binding protein [Ruminiclostridium sp.]|nr:extracellular solute-binding protein [Ruminiclostridium sp.]
MKKFLSCFLCAAMVLGITGCSQDENSPNENNTPTVTTEDDNPVDVSDVDLDLDKDVDLNGKVLHYIGCYDITTAGDIKPAYVYFKETYGADIQVDIYGDGEIMDKLTTMINGGDSPDLIDQRSNSFPYYIGQNAYMPLDEYMDTSAPQWAAVSSFIEKYAINGKHYYYPWACVVGTRYLIYNRGKFNEIGIDDPKTLYDQGNWTWDTFQKCMTGFVDAVKGDVPDVIGLYGSVANCFINSTGVPMVGLENGQLTNNLDNANIDRAQAFLENLKKQGLSSLQYSEYSNVATDPIVNGYAAFQSVGDWLISDYAKKQNKNPELDIFFVPFPKDPNADRHYQSLSTFAYLVPAGAPNPQASCIFINCVRLSKTDPTLMETTKASIMKSKKYTEEQYELWNYFQTVENFDPDDLVSDFAYNIDTETCDKVISKICEDVPFVDGDDIQSWTVMRTSMAPLLEKSLNDINATLK